MTTEVFGKYEVVEKIGEGGFGKVYKGRDPDLKRFAAVKTCTSEDRHLRERFFREAEIAASLQHPNITTIYDFDYQEGTPYLVQEYLAGEDLDHKIRRGDAMDVGSRLGILLQVAAGLAYAHGRGVVHRDVKPANVRILDDGHVKIMDFGIAKLLTAEHQLTQTGMAMGTAGYLPPEQIRGQEVDSRADVFSFGVLAYELMTGVRPFQGDDLSAILYKITHEEPVPVATRWPECPPRLAACISRCLAKNPDDRYPGFAEVITEISALTLAPRHSEEVPAAPVTAAAPSGGRLPASPVGPTVAAPSGDRLPAPPIGRPGAPPAGSATAGPTGGPVERTTGGTYQTFLGDPRRRRLAGAVVAVLLLVGLGWWALSAARNGVPDDPAAAGAAPPVATAEPPVGTAPGAGGAMEPEAPVEPGAGGERLAVAAGAAAGQEGGRAEPAAEQQAAPAPTGARPGGGQAPPPGGAESGGRGRSGATAPETEPAPAALPAGGTPAPRRPGPPAAVGPPANPRYLVLIAGADDAGSASAETAFVGALTEAGAPVIDPGAAERLRADERAMAAARGGDAAQLVAIGRQNGADVVVAGTLAAEAQPGVGNFFTGRAVLDLKTYDASSGRYLGAKTVRVGSGGTPGKLEPSEAGARSAASEEVGRLGAAAALAQVRAAIGGPGETRLVIYGIASLADAERLKAALGDVDGVSAVRQRVFEADARLELGVDYDGTAGELGARLEGLGVAGRRLHVTGVENRRLTVEVR